MIENATPSAFLHEREVVGRALPTSYPVSDVEVKGFLKSSLVDWDGYITAVVFLSLCNLRCPMCHNHEIVLTPENYPDIPLEEIEKYLVENRDFIDGVVITGGEPTLHKGLPDFCRWLKNIGMMVKLDTNGTYPERLQHLIDDKLVDFIAMDIKAPLNDEAYRAVSGTSVDVENIRRSISIIMKSGLNYEFRTTVIPTFHTAEDLVEMAKSIEGAKLFVLQQFNPDNTLDPKLGKVEPYSREELEEIAKECKPFVSKTKVRA